jgi:glycosyltransferase involved in cell wall biosynthesis
MFISVITVTYRRSAFLPALLNCYLNQTYCHSQMEWLLLDDSDTEEQEFTQELIHDFVKEHEERGLHIRYIRSNTKEVMGKKLNQSTSLCRGDLIIVMDDDDYYPPTRVTTVVNAFHQHPTYQLAGCSKVYMHFQEEDAIYVAGPYHEKHALHCTMAYRATYLLDHAYDDKEVCAIEKVFTNNFTEPMIQLDTVKTILHTVHPGNTYKKKREVTGLRRTEYTKDMLRKISL